MKIRELLDTKEPFEWEPDISYSISLLLLQTLGLCIL